MLNVLKNALVLFSCLWLVTAVADDKALEKETTQQATFKQAEKALSKGKQEQFETLSQSLKDYPLYPYLQYDALTKNLKKTNSKQIDAFLKANADSPLAYRLRGKWLNYLFKAKRWPAILRYYQPSKKVDLQCIYLTALVETGQRERAYKQVPSIWETGRSLPNDCDDLLKGWIKNNKLTPELAWQRFQLAMQSRNSRLGKYLVRHLSEQDQMVAKQWIKIYKNPKLITKDGAIDNSNAKINLGVVYGIKRLARKDPDLLIKNWQAILKRFSLTKAQRQQALRAIAITLAATGHPQAMVWLTKNNDSNADKYTLEWQLRTALKKQDWQAVLKIASNLPRNESIEPIWQYWQARAFEKTGNKSKAKAIYKTLSKERNYYGFLASYRLKTKYQIKNTPLVVSGKNIEKLEKIPGIKRAKELYQMGRFLDARREWNAAMKNMTPEQLKTATVLAQYWNWHDRSILTNNKTQHKDAIAMRFPLGFKEEVLEAADQEDIDPAWLFAVIRQESAFISDIGSRAGAVGLMQLMPGTAKHVSRTLRVNYDNIYDILNSETNIRFGSHYLKRMYNKYKNPVLATASYNAGPGNVKKWLKKRNNMAADIWVETIPFKETRNYVKNVMTYTLIYQQQLGEKPSLARWQKTVR